MINYAYQDFIMQITAGICLTVLLIVVLILMNRSKISKQKTLQTLLETGQELTPEVLETIGIPQKNQPQKDFRRGVLMIISGGILTVAFKLMGGIAWVFGFFPMIIGFVYLIFSRIKLAQP